MDMIALTVVLCLISTCVGCAITAYKVVQYRDSHLEEWSEVQEA